MFIRFNHKFEYIFQKRLIFEDPNTLEGGLHPINPINDIEE